MKRRGRQPVKMLAAAHWLSAQPTLMVHGRQEIWYRRGGPRSPVNPAWRVIADAVREAGFFSRQTGTIDVPVLQIVQHARRFAQEREALR